MAQTRRGGPIGFGRRRSPVVETHTYICSWRVFVLTMVVVGVVALLCDAIWHPWIVYGPFVDIGFALGAGALVGRGSTLVLSPETVQSLGGTCNWEHLELARTPFGEVLRTKRGAKAQRITVFLRLYGVDWGEGPIGDDVRAWAPHLLAERE